MAVLSSPSLPPIIVGDFSLLYSDLQQIPNFPCLTCPFIRVLDGGKPICTIYSHQAVGLESCKEVSRFLKENSKKELLKDSVLVFNEEDVFGKV